MRRFGFFALLCAVLTAGCNLPDAEVTRSDVEKNKQEFSQEAYEDAMIKAGKGAELEAEKKRNAAYLSGQQPDQGSASQPLAPPGASGEANPDESR